MDSDNMYGGALWTPELYTEGAMKYIDGTWIFFARLNAIIFLITLVIVIVGAVVGVMFVKEKFNRWDEARQRSNYW